MLGFPVELVAEILSELDVPDLVHASQVSRGMRAVVGDAALNPWRRAVKRALRAGAYSALRSLNGYTAVPEQTWIEILAVAPAPVVLFDACVPRLAAADWADAFARRFLPAWRRWKRDASWKEVYLRSALPPPSSRRPPPPPPLLTPPPGCSTGSGTAPSPPALPTSLGQSALRPFCSPISRSSVYKGTLPSTAMAPPASSRLPPATLIPSSSSTRSSQSPSSSSQAPLIFPRQQANLAHLETRVRVCYIIALIRPPAYVQLGCSGTHGRQSPCLRNSKQKIASFPQSHCPRLSPPTRHRERF
jgi:hypothetical protein